MLVFALVEHDDATVVQVVAYTGAGVVGQPLPASAGLPVCVYAVYDEYAAGAGLAERVLDGACGSVGS